MNLPWHWTLARRLSAVFVVLLLICSSVSIWLQVAASGRYEQEVTQRLSRGLAEHIASNAELVRGDGLNDALNPKLRER